MRLPKTYEFQIGTNTAIYTREFSGRFAIADKFRNSLIFEHIMGNMYTQEFKTYWVHCLYGHPDPFQVTVEHPTEGFPCIYHMRTNIERHLILHKAMLEIRKVYNKTTEGRLKYFKPYKEKFDQLSCLHDF